VASEYLSKFGEAVLNNGYSIVFIRPGEKRPFGKDWESKKLGPKALASFIDQGRGDFGLGIKSARTPGVDIDCYDEDIVNKMRDFTVGLLGETIERVAQLRRSRRRNLKSSSMTTTTM
jgi:hypothetical protein